MKEGNKHAFSSARRSEIAIELILGCFKFSVVKGDFEDLVTGLFL
jgi:hypothetical protein